jgi:hypothetical protein
LSPHQKNLFDDVSRRWHTTSWAGLTVQQATMDIGVLSGIIVDLDEQLNSKQTPEGK